MNYHIPPGGIDEIILKILFSSLSLKFNRENNEYPFITRQTTIYPKDMADTSTNLNSSELERGNRSKKYNRKNGQITSKAKGAIVSFLQDIFTYPFSQAKKRFPTIREKRTKDKNKKQNPQNKTG